MIWYCLISSWIGFPIINKFANAKPSVGVIGWWASSFHNTNCRMIGSIVTIGVFLLTLGPLTIRWFLISHELMVFQGIENDGKMVSRIIAFKTESWICLDKLCSILIVFLALMIFSSITSVCCTDVPLGLPILVMLKFSFSKITSSVQEWFATSVQFS